MRTSFHHQSEAQPPNGTLTAATSPDTPSYMLSHAVGLRAGRNTLTRNPTAEWLARQITEAFPWTSAPAYLIRDNDPGYGHAFRSRVRAMGIRDRPISPASPWQNGHVERLIGTVRRECLDRMLIFGEAHLRRVLASYAVYYNQARTHLALQKDAPLHRAVQRSGVVVAIPSPAPVQARPVATTVGHEYWRNE